MIKKKNVLISLFLGLCLVLMLCLFASCRNNPTSESKQPNNSITLNVNEVEIDLFEDVQLLVSGTYEGSVAWNSSNELVATVDGGKVTAKSIGTTTISAVVGGESHACEVTVKDSGARPVLSCQESTGLGVKVGQKYQVNTSTLYKGNKIQAKVLYEIADTDIAQVSSEGEITGVEFGSTTLTIAGEYRGYTFLPLEIPVNIVGDMSIELSKGDLTLYASSPNGEEVATTLTAKLIKEGQEITANNFEWIIADENVAVCDSNGNVQAVGAGVTTLTVACVVEGREYRAMINVEVLRPVITFKNIDIDLSKSIGDYAVLNLGYDCTSISEASLLVGQNIALEILTENDSVKIKKDVLEANLGVAQMEILSAKAQYVGQVTIASLVISDKEELADMMEISTDGEEKQTIEGYENTAVRADGYFVLDNDIDYEDESFGVTGFRAEKDGFVGVFDGRGHTIKNIVVKYETDGLFGNIGKKGVVRNVAFVGVKNLDKNPAVDYVRRNLLCYTHYGTIENVYVEATRGAITGHFSGVIGQYNTGGIVKNLVAVITEAAGKCSGNLLCVGAAIGGMQNNASAVAPVKNIIAISSYYPAIAYNGWGDCHKTATNVQSFTSVAEANGTYSADDWDTSIWNISHSIPVFKSYVWAEDLTAEESFGYIDLSLDTAQSLDWSALEGEVVEIRANNNTIISNNATIALNEESKTALLGGQKYGEVFLLVKTQSDKGERLYKVKVVAVTMVIYDADDLEALKEAAGVGETKSMADGYTYYDTLDGYFVLANDVNYENREFGLTRTTANTQGFIGTFDGRGHVISNIKVADGSTGLFGNVGTAGVIKNVAFVNVQNTETNDHGDGYNRRNLLCYTHSGKIENVYVEATRGTINGAFSGAIGMYNSGAVVKNLVAIITETAGKSSSVCVGTAIGAMQNNATETAPVDSIVAVSSLYPAIQYNGWGDCDKTATKVKSFASIAAANGTYSAEDWDTSIWNINNGLPIFKNMVWVNDQMDRGSVVYYDLSVATAQDFSLEGFTGEVVSITKDDGTEVGNWSFANGKLTLNSAFATEMLAGKAYGDVVVRFNVESEAGKSQYRAKFAFVTKVIYDADDLEKVMSIATKDATFGGGDYYTDVAQKADGYYVLANNIDFANGEFGLTHGSTGDGFIGIFDGRGYVISNIAVKYESVGLFGQIGKAGVVRNVAFVGVTNTTNKANADYVRRNILAFVAKGKIENVYVEATRSTSVGSFSGVIGQCDGATVHNVVAIITETGNKNTSGVCLGAVIGAHGNTKPTADTIKNLIGVSKYYPVIATNTWSDWETIGTNVYGYASVEAVNATYSAEDWDTSIWDITGKVPVFKSMKTA